MHTHGQIFVPLITPNNHEDFFPLIDHVIGGGVKDLILFGTTGEGLKVDLKTKMATLNKIAPYVKGRAHLSIGLLCSSLQEAMTLANFSYELGVRSGLFPPMLYGDHAESIVDELLHQTELDLYLYNPPSFIAKAIPNALPFVGRPQILGIKDSCLSSSQLPEFINSLRTPHFQVYLGKENELEELLSLGIDGLVPGSANVCPQLFVDVWKERTPKAFAELKAYKEQLREYCPSDYIQGLKIALQRMNIIK